MFAEKFHPSLASCIHHCADDQSSHSESAADGEDAEDQRLQQYLFLLAQKYYPHLIAYIQKQDDDQSSSEARDVDEKDCEEERLKQCLLLFAQKFYPRLVAYIHHCDDDQSSSVGRGSGDKETKKQHLKQSLLSLAQKYYPSLANCIRQCDDNQSLSSGGGVDEEEAEKQRLKRGLLLFAENYYPSLAAYIRQWDDDQSTCNVRGVGEEDNEVRRLKRGLILLAQKYYPPLAAYICHCDDEVRGVNVENEKESSSTSSHQCDDDQTLNETCVTDKEDNIKHELKQGLLLFAEKYYPILATYIHQCEGDQSSHDACDVDEEEAEEQLLKQCLLMFADKFYPTLATYIRQCGDSQSSFDEEADTDSNQCPRHHTQEYLTPSATCSHYSNDDLSTSDARNVDEESDGEQRLKQGLLLLARKHYPTLATYICQCDDSQPSFYDSVEGEEATEEQRLKQCLLLFAKKFYPCLANYIRQCDGNLLLIEEFVEGTGINSDIDATEVISVEESKVVCNEVNEAPSRCTSNSTLPSEIHVGPFEKAIPPTDLTVDTSFQNSLCHSVEGGGPDSPFYNEHCTVGSIYSTAPLSQSSSTKLYFSNTEEFTTEEVFSPITTLSTQRRIRIYLEDLENVRKVSLIPLCKTDKLGNPQEEIVIDSNLDSCTDESKLSSVDVEFTMEQADTTPLDLESQDEDLKKCIAVILKHIWSELIECIRREGLSDIYELSLGDRRIEVSQDDVCLNLTYLRRKYPICVPQYITINGGTQELTVEQQIYIEGKKEEEEPIIEVLLTDNVSGVLDTNILYGHSFETQQRLLNMTLYIPMNPSIPWTLTPKHVKVAFRRIGVIVREGDITMPEKPVSASTLEEFIINVNIENKVSVPVKCRIFLYQRLDAKTTTKPPSNTFRKIRLDDWTSDFPDDELRLLPGFTNKPYRSRENPSSCLRIPGGAPVPEIGYIGTVLSLDRRPPPLQTTLRTFWRASSSEAKARLQTLFSIQREKGWSKKCKKVPLTPANQAALNHFDKYYSHIFGVAAWSGIRVALLAPPAKVAVLNSVSSGLRECAENLRSNNYLDLFSELNKPNARILDKTNSLPLPHYADSVESVAGRKFLVQQEAPLGQVSEFLPPTELVSERDLYARDSDQAFLIHPESDLLQQAPDLPMVKEEEEEANGKESNLVKSFRNLRCFVPPCGMFSALPQPTYSDGCFDFYPLDLGSVLTVLMLDVQPGTRMLDLCSAPGGKAVTALQTLNLGSSPPFYPVAERLVCTDVSPSRLERLHRVLAGFAWGVGSGRNGLPDVKAATTATLQRLWCRSGERFSRVLVDVPCSTDRDALTTPAGGYFARGKAAARVGLVEKQRTLLHTEVISEDLTMRESKVPCGVSDVNGALCHSWTFEKSYLYDARHYIPRLDEITTVFMLVFKIG
ncbi:5-methylcytosine rRNA methyltransferase NSUN4 [Taenia solium]|eukprot:TsM_000965400 transcript=TsM_000965400 gene=TsM_000965400